MALNAIPGYAAYTVAHGLPTSNADFDAYLDEADRGFPCAPAKNMVDAFAPTRTQEEQFLRAARHAKTTATIAASIAVDSISCVVKL